MKRETCSLALLLAALVSFPIRGAAALGAASPASTGTVEITLETGDFSLEETVTGDTLVRIDGFSQTGEPGQPLMPQRMYFVALPQGVDPATVQLAVTGGRQETLSGSHGLALATADITSGNASATLFPQATVNAINQEANGSVSIVSSGQLRQWRFVRVAFSPVLYWPDSGRLDLVTSLTLELTYDLPSAKEDRTQPHDGLADDQARDLFVNFDEARSWYTKAEAKDMPGASFDYVIITTTGIVSNSTKLADFVTHKEGRGHSVLVVTETDYGGLTGQLPNGTAEKIRQWLIDNYAGYGIEYVLLIGNPDPDYGDVPMKMCWPLYHSSTYRESPTDYFYADLTGNWDLNGDQNYCVWGDDTGTGGVDYTAEVKVGRIPMYGNNYATLDSILQKTIDYDDEAAPLGWRLSSLLPMSFSTTSYDGAPLAEQMMDDYLTDGGHNLWTMYQQGGGACSLNSGYTSDQELRGGTAVRTQWAANGYGLVVWWGHGSETAALVGCSGCWDGNIMSTSDAPYLDDDHPALVFQNSCLNGSPEYSSNLAYALLKNGAVATVGASRVSWFNTAVKYGDFDGSTTNSGIAYEFAKRIVAGQTAGEALYNAKGSMTPEYNTRMMNFTDFNLYGDPAMDIFSGRPFPASGLEVSAASSTTIRILWRDNSSNETGFQVESSRDGASDWQVLTTVGAGITSTTDITDPYDAPFYRVGAVNDHGIFDYAGPKGLFWMYFPITIRS